MTISAVKNFYLIVSQYCINTIKLARCQAFNTKLSSSASTILSLPGRGHKVHPIFSAQAEKISYWI